MDRYREIYEKLNNSISRFGYQHPMVTDDLLREAGISAQESDNREAGLEAVVIYLVEEVRDLKKCLNQMNDNKALSSEKMK